MYVTAILLNSLPIYSNKSLEKIHLYTILSAMPALPEVLPLLRRDASLPAATSETWAQVITNVAPLVILIGEKNLKGYLKACNHWAHIGLYAVTPIGALSAVISVLRLVAGRTLKTLLGRQHEREADIYLDITSLSTELIGQHYTDSTAVEQVTDLDPTKEAKFLLRGSTVGSLSSPKNIHNSDLSNESIFDILKFFRGLGMTTGRGRKAPFKINHLPNRIEALVVVALYRPLEQADDLEVLESSNQRASALTWKINITPSDCFNAERIALMAISGGVIQDGNEIKAFSKSYVHKLMPHARAAIGFEVTVPGVSHVLTLSQPKHAHTSNLIIVVTQFILCVGFLAAIVFGNQQSELRTAIIFASIGYAVVVVGMWLLFWTIMASTAVIPVSIPPIRCGAVSTASRFHRLGMFTKISIHYLFQRSRREQLFIQLLAILGQFW